MEQLRGIGFGVLVLLAGIGLFGGSALLLSILDEFWFHADDRPSNEIKTVADYCRWQRPTGSVEKAEVRGATYYLVKGPYARVLPSDKSAHLFDSRGNIVSGTLDIGDYRHGLIRTFHESTFPTISVDQFLYEVGVTNETPNMTVNRQ